VTVQAAEPGPETNLANQFAAAVRERTGGRLRDGRITLNGDVITVPGVAPSFYVKQLALEAARATLRGLPSRLELEIDVHAL
jgi:hypothetical protein